MLQTKWLFSVQDAGAFLLNSEVHSKQVIKFTHVIKQKWLLMRILTVSKNTTAILALTLTTMATTHTGKEYE
jgi:hypothetical protein